MRKLGRAIAAPGAQHRRSTTLPSLELRCPSLVYRLAVFGLSLEQFGDCPGYPRSFVTSSCPRRIEFEKTRYKNRSDSLESLLGSGADQLTYWGFGQRAAPQGAGSQSIGTAVEEKMRHSSLVCPRTAQVIAAPCGWSTSMQPAYFKIPALFRPDTGLQAFELSHSLWLSAGHSVESQATRLPANVVRARESNIVCSRLLVRKGLSGIRSKWLGSVHMLLA